MQQGDTAVCLASRLSVPPFAECEDWSWTRPPATPSVEDRISVALARRGDIPAATFIEGAVFSDWISRKSSESATHALSHFLDLNDDDFAAALEAHADDLEALVGRVL